MFIKKAAAFFTGAVVLALALPVFAVSQTSEKTADATPAARQTAETAPAEARETADATPAAQESVGTERTNEPWATEDAHHEAASTVSPFSTPLAKDLKKRAGQGSLSLYMDGKDLTGGQARIKWQDLSTTPPTAILKAIGPDGSVVSPIYDSSDDGVVCVDESGLVTAVGYGVAVITATLDAQKAMVQVSVEREVRRVVIIGEDSVSHGRSIKLRAFDQDGNRINAVWRSSSEALATISADGVLTARRNASGQSVDITAFADETLGVFAVKNIRID